MATYNRITMIGNLTKNPDPVREVGASKVCRINIASNRTFKNKQTGAVTQDVCFIDVDVWGAQADSAFKYLEKGRAVLVDGRLKYDTWKDAEGNARNKHSIVAENIQFLGSRNEGQAGAPAEGADLLGPIPSMSPLPEAGSDAKASLPRKGTKKAAASVDSPAEFKVGQPFEDDLPF